MPVVHPADVWRRSGRYDADRARAGPLQGPRRTRHGPRDDPRGSGRRAAPPTSSRSYRQLPIIVYHFQTKFRDEPRSRGGLIRVREFVMKDSYSCDRDEAGPRRELLATTTRPTTRIFERLGLEAIPVSSDVGIMGGIAAPTSSWSSTRPARTSSSCATTCDYADNRRSRSCPSPSPRREDPPARGGRRDAGHDDDRDARRRSSASARSATAKAAFFVTGDGRLVTAIVRGDYEVNETKLANAVKAIGGIRPAHGRGDQRGAAWSRATARRSVPRIPSSSSTSSSRARRTLSPGANRVGWHVRNVNVPPRLRAGRSSPTSRTPARAIPARVCGVDG